LISEFGVSCKHLINLFFVNTHSDISLELLGGSKVSSRNAEITRNKFEFPDIGSPRDDQFVAFIKAGLDMVDNLLVLASVRGFLNVQAKCFFKVLLSFKHQVIRHTSCLGIGVNLEGDNSGNESLVLTNYHDVAAWVAAQFKLVLDRNRCDVLTTCCDDDLLDTTSDLDELTNHHTLVTRAKVAILINTFPCGFLITKIAHHDMSTFHTNLSLAFRVSILYLDMDTIHGHSCGPLAELVVNKLYD